MEWDLQYFCPHFPPYINMRITSAIMKSSHDGNKDKVGLKKEEKQKMIRGKSRELSEGEYSQISVHLHILVTD